MPPKSNPIKRAKKALARSNRSLAQALEIAKRLQTNFDNARHIMDESNREFGM